MEKSFTLKNVFYFSASVLVTMVILGQLFRIVSVQDVSALIRNIAPAPALCFILLSLAQTFIQAWRYSLLLEASRVRLSMPILFLVATARNLFSDLLPARIGTLSYVLILTGRLNVRADKALSSFALAFVFDILAIFPLVALALIASHELVSTDLRVLIPLIGCLFFCIWMLLRHLATLLRLSAAGMHRLEPFKKAATLFEDTARQINDIREAGVYLPVFFLSLTGRLLKYGKLFFLLLALLNSRGYDWQDIGLARFFLGVSGAEFAASLPISGIAAFGAYEGAWALIFSLLGFPKELAVGTGISHHLITQAYGYSIGVVALLLLVIPGIGNNAGFREKPLSQPRFFMRLSLFLILTGGMILIPFSLNHGSLERVHLDSISLPEPNQNPSTSPSPLSEQETKAMKRLTAALQGHILFTRSRRIFKQEVGKWNPEDLGEGEYARWGPSGKHIAVYDRGSIFIMRDDGTKKRKLIEIPHKAQNCPIEFHPNGREILFIRPDQGLWTVGINGDPARPFPFSVNFDGEPGISATGARLAARRGNRLFALDLTLQEVRQYGRGCSPGISPDGTQLMQNLHGHQKMLIRDFHGIGVFGLSAGSCLPDGKWDNHHWSNHNNYIAAQGNGDVKEVYIVSVSENYCYRVTWVGNTGYPDLFVKQAFRS